MGIRFFCPNGHKLNVKTELAGKHGICPHCGVRMEIPLESTRESEKKQSAVEELQLSGSLSNPDTDQSRLFPMEEPAVSHEKTEQDLSSVDSSSSQVPPEVSSSSGSVLDDMTVVWYVQAANGQRFGPATGPIIKTWIQEKRIGPTMLVWREGWPEWLQAKHVFPEVAQMFKPAGTKEKTTVPPTVTKPKPAPTISASSKTKTPVPDLGNVAEPMFDLGDFDDLAEDVDLEAESTGLGLRTQKKPIENFGLIVGFLIAMVVMLIVLGIVLYINTRPKKKKPPQIRVNVVSFEAANHFPFSIT